MSGRFKKGQSGNPAGRPPGIPNHSTKLRAAIAKDLPEIIDVLRKQALSGDVSAARLLLERALPTLRPESAPVALPDLKDRLDARAEAISQAALNGQIPPNQAAELMTMLTGQARVLEMSELMERLERLERVLSTTTKE